MTTAAPKAPKRSKFLLLFGSIWLICGLPFFFLGVHLVKVEKRYEAEALTVPGIVQGKRMEERRDSDNKGTTKTYYVSYKFSTKEGRSIESEGSVDSDAWQGLAEGAEIQIQYLPSDDTQNRVASEPSIIAGVLVAAMGLICMLLGGGCIFFDLKKRALLRRLLRDGELGEATILTVGPGNLTINNVQQWRIHYSFKDRMGKEIRGKSEHMPPEEAHNWNEGDKGKVRFDRSNPQINMWVGNFVR